MQNIAKIYGMTSTDGLHSLLLCRLERLNTPSRIHAEHLLHWRSRRKISSNIYNSWLYDI